MKRSKMGYLRRPQTSIAVVNKFEILKYHGWDRKNTV